MNWIFSWINTAPQAYVNACNPGCCWELRRAAGPAARCHSMRNPLTISDSRKPLLPSKENQHLHNVTSATFPLQHRGSWGRGYPGVATCTCARSSQNRDLTSLPHVTVQESPTTTKQGCSSNLGIQPTLHIGSAMAQGYHYTRLQLCQGFTT